MAQLAAIMSIFNHIKGDIECLDENATLLKTVNYFVSAESEEMKSQQGAYLYFDVNNVTWIRSGKVTGRGFSVRHSEHAKKAAAKKTTSLFYNSYPTSTSARNKSVGRKGYFDNLSQFVAIGFDVNNDEHGKIITGELENGGLFSYTNEEKRKIDSCNMRGRGTTMLKRIDIVAYLFELGYDLSISPADNVSQNPGFESVLGVW